MYGEIYIMKILNARKKHHIQNHHKFGLFSIRNSPAQITSPVSTVDMSIDFIESLIHNPDVIVLKPYLFSILKTEYKLKGIDINVSAKRRIIKNINPERMKGRFNETTHELYKSNIPPNRKKT